MPYGVGGEKGAVVSGNLIEELKRRKVFKVGAAYLVVAWLAVQAASIAFPAFEAPPWALRVFILLALLGFPLAVVMAWVFETSPEGVHFDPVRAGTKRIVAVAVALAALALAWFFYGQASVHPGEKAVPIAEAGTKAPPAEPAADPKSIAVLAFTDLSPKHDQDYFSDGVSEEILNALVRVQDLKVAGRTSSFYYKGKNTDLREIGKALGVAHVLEGSVRTQGDKVRITAQLIRATDGIHLWSKTFDGTLDDVFKLQDQVARAIVDELKPVLEGNQQTQLVAQATDNAEAYRLYLQASDLLNRRDYPRAADAIAWLEEALRLDPHFTRAESQLALVQMLLNRQGPNHAAEAEKHARAAMAADPTLAQPYYTLGLVHRYARHYAEARPLFEKAVALEPRDASAHMYLAQWLITTGYTRDGIAELDRAIAIDPMLPNAVNWRAYQYLYAGDLGNADALFQRTDALGLSLAKAGLAEMHLARGNIAEARRGFADSLRSSQRPCPGSPDYDALFGGFFGADAAAQARSRAVVEACVATHPEELPAWVVGSYLRLQDFPRALDLFANNITSDDAGIAFRMFSPEGAKLRELPNFSADAAKIGWLDAWEKYGAPDTCTRSAPRVYTCH
jgi:TolB-like protein/tetratricopeptide (TPR) repeat protein